MKTLKSILIIFISILLILTTPHQKVDFFYENSYSLAAYQVISRSKLPSAPNCVRRIDKLLNPLFFILIIASSFILLHTCFHIPFFSMVNIIYGGYLFSRFTLSSIQTVKSVCSPKRCQRAKKEGCKSCQFLQTIHYDPMVQYFKEIFSVFNFSCLPKTRKGNPTEVYVKSFIVMVDQKLSSIPDFRKFLLRHPALVAFIGFHLKGYHPHFGFDPEVTVPTSRHLRRRLQEIQNRHLKLLLYNTVRSLKELGLVNDEVIMDTTEIIARVKENNPKQFVSNRYNKNKIPKGNPDSRLGVKPSTNKSKDGKTKLRYFWGFKNGAAFQETKHGIITLNEETKAANSADVNFFFPLIKPIKDTLRITIKTFIADAAFDAWYVYHFVTKGKGTAFIPINTRGHKILQHGYGPNGRPLCPDNREMANAGAWFDKKKGYRRQKYICPLIDPHTGKRKQNQTCRCDHPKWQKKGCYKYINLDDPENSRFAIDRESCLFKRTYKKRTIAERGFSIIKNYNLEDPIFRNEDSIVNLYTIAYALMNAKVILKAKEESLPQEEALLQETAA